jgi:triosephosphate isomerase
MYRGFTIDPPFFEIGPKAYLYGEEVLALAMHADQVSEKYNVQVVFTPQYVDIPILARQVKNIFIFAQHMDYLDIGRGVGSVLPEAVKAAGAAGVLLNHAEKPLSLEEIDRTIQRADEVGLGTMVCADAFENAAAVAHLGPNILLAESPKLIGIGKRGDDDQQAITKINQIVWDINPDIRVMHSAGISNGEDVYQIIAAGAQATGSTSGIIKALDPYQMLEEMIASVRRAWDITHKKSSGE